MKRDYIDFQERSEPVGYLITIRCYGTWLHGDHRGSVNRRSYNRYGENKIEPNFHLEKSDKEFLKNPPFRLSALQREAVKSAIKEVCDVRGIVLYALNVRSNHAHIAVKTSRPPEPIMNSFKSYATRKLRELGLVGSQEKIWARHGSTKYLWSEEQLCLASHYVENEQGEELRFE